MSIERIVVGVDGSPNAERALEWACGVAGATGAAVLAVHAVGLIEDRSPASETEPETIDGVTIHRLVEHGDPVSVLLRTARAESADLIVVGSRGVGGHPELLLGSTSTQVAQRADRPVVVVPHHDTSAR